MLRRIVVALDPSEYSQTAVDGSCYYAHLVGATVVGVGVIDRPSIEHAEYGGGTTGAHYAAKAVERRLDAARQTLTERLAQFESTCRAMGVRFESELRTGAPVDEILEVANGADIIASGTRTYLEFATRSESDDTVSKLLRAHVCPVQAFPMGPRPPFGRVVIAYDRSAASLRALRTYVYQCFDRPFLADVTLLTVDDNADEALHALENPRRFLAAYGFQVRLEVESGPVTETIRRVATAEPNSLLVLGSRGRRALTETLFGGTTHELLEDGNIAMLLAG